MAGGVVGEQSVPCCAEVGDAKFVHEVFGKFKDTFAKCFCARMPLFVAFEEFKQVVSEMMRARARGCDDIPLGLLEQFDGVLCHFFRICPKTGVELRLSATGLVGGEVHADAEALENVHDGLTSFGEERIGEAGDEELDAGHVSIIRLTFAPSVLEKYFYDLRVEVFACLFFDIAICVFI